MTSDFKLGAAAGVGLLLFFMMMAGYDWAGLGFVVLLAMFDGKDGGA